MGSEGGWLTWGRAQRMAEATVSLDDPSETDEGTRLPDRGAPSEDRSAGAPGPKATRPLPRRRGGRSSEPAFIEDEADEDEQPTVARDRWVRDPSYWETQSLIVVGTGRLTVPPAPTVPLPPPQRFRPMRRWQSLLALVVVAGIIVLSCAGILQATRLANSLLRSAPAPTAIPTVVPTVAPTVTPRGHK